MTAWFLRCLVLGVAFLILVMPAHPDWVRASTFARFPLELPVLLLAIIALSSRLLPVIAAVLLTALSVLKTADLAMVTAYDRPFNPVIDLGLIPSGVSLLGDSIGRPLAWAALLGALLILVALFTLLRAGLIAWTTLPLTAGPRATTAFAALLATAYATTDAAHANRLIALGASPPGTTSASRLVLARAQTIQATAADLATFRRAAAQDPYKGRPDLLNALQGRDVLLIWIESYGRASFDNPLYAPTHQTTLAEAEAALTSQNLAMHSGWLASPTAGGQSWLAHGALASGLWTSDQGRYRAMLASGRDWLFHHAARAGYRTGAIMPAITLDWPEARAMGFDDVHAAADIPYDGPAFNWVTMPDQHTLAASRSLLPDTQPHFTQIALISSHAPWTPILDILPWDQMGDGAVFAPMADRGPTPRTLWRDRDAVRDAYRRSLDYSLNVTFQHLARLGADAPLTFVIGDHQVAGFVAGSADPDVPFHVIGPPKLLARIDDWPVAPGLIPPTGPSDWPMDAFRDRFLEAFTDPARQAGFP